jgi:phosphoribosylanthranilate isomerase
MSLWVKLCGVRSEADIAAAVAAGADAVGMVMTSSVRQIDIHTARRLVAEAEDRLTTVAVFYWPDRDLVESVRDQVPFDLFQAESETLEGISGIQTLPVVHDRPDLASAVRRLTTSLGSRRILVESAGRGGTGLSPDWGRVATIGRLDNVVIAGGLTSENVAAAVANLGPAGVDVSSGVESEPGVKDHELMARFVQAARDAVREGVS